MGFGSSAVLQDGAHDIHAPLVSQPDSMINIHERRARMVLQVLS